MLIVLVVLVVLVVVLGLDLRSWAIAIEIPMTTTRSELLPEVEVEDAAGNVAGSRRCAR